jgi:hypothetical protein
MLDVPVNFQHVSPRKQGKPYRFQFGFGKYYFLTFEKRFSPFLPGIIAGLTRQILATGFLRIGRRKLEEWGRAGSPFRERGPLETLLNTNEILLLFITVWVR